MNYGLYLSGSGLLTNLYQQDVYANNLANVKTAGFKRDLASIRQRDAESVEEQLGGDVSQRMLDRLGGGVLAGPQRISFAPAPLERTGGDLDVALQAPNAFFAVHDQDASGNVQIRLTRDGRFTRNAHGQLATIAGGKLVLDVQDRAISLPETGKITIDPSGRIFADAEEIGRLQVTGVHDTDRLRKTGQNLFAWPGGDDPRRPAQSIDVRQGYIEASGVDPVLALMDLIGATKAATSNGNLIRYHDLLMDRAVNVLGRVA